MLSPYKQHGMTLVELMVALAVGLLLTGAVLALFIQNNANTRQNEVINRMQESGRFAIQILRNELQHTALLGSLNDGYSVTNGSLTDFSNCGSTGDVWYRTIQRVTDRIDYRTNLLSTNLTAVPLPCVSSATFIDHGNVLISKRTTANPITNVSGGADNKFYIRTNSAIGDLYQFTSDTALKDIGGNMQDWEYQANIFYVGRKVGDNTIPVLYRSYLQGGATPSMATEPLVEGVEYFSIEFGIDSNNDGIANYYTDTPAGTEFDQLVSARVQVLIRADRQERGYANAKNYIFGNGINVSQRLNNTDTFGDAYYRRAFNTTIVLNNPRNQALLGQ